MIPRPPRSTLDRSSAASDVYKRQVVFGDSKEGVFGVRVPTSMDVEQKVNKSAEPGHIINSEGLTDAAAWGKPASWVDYFGKVAGCLLYTSPSPRDRTRSRMPSSA